MKKNILLILLLIFATIIRIYGLDFQSFWLDEGFTYFIVSQNLQETINSCVLQQQLPPLYFVLMNFWIKIGESEFIIRLFSALFGIFSVFMIYKLAKILFNKKVALFSAFLFTINPFHIHYSQEARPYALLIFLVICSAYFFIKILKHDNNICWILFTLSLIGCIYTHYFSFYILFLYNILLFSKYKEDKNIFKKWLLSNLIIILSYTFWFPILIKSFSEVGGYKMLRPIIYRLVELPKVFFVFTVGYSAMETTSFENVINDVISNSYIILPVVLVCFFLIFKAFKRGALKEYSFIFCSLFLFFPIIFTFIIEEYIKSGIMNPRYFIMFLPFYVILVAVGLEKIKKRTYLIICLLLIIIPSYFSLNNYFFNEQYWKNDWRGASKYIEKESKATDIIFILFPSKNGSPFDYYYHGISKQVYLSNLINFNKINSFEADNFLKKILFGYGRVWLFNLDWENWDKRELVRQGLKKKSQKEKFKYFHKLPLYLYELK